MRPRHATVIAWALWAVAVGVGLATIPLVVANRDAPIQGYFGTASLEVVFILIFLSFPTVGALVARRLPRNAVGWLLVAGGLSFVFSVFANEFAVYGTFTTPGALPGTSFMLWASATWSWTPGFGLLAALFLLFPTGRPLSSRWRIVLQSVVVGIVLLTVGYAFRPGPFDPPWTFVTNPYAPAGVLGDVMTVVNWIGNGASGLAILLGAASLVIRFRRASGVERQQLKWLAYAASLLAAYLPFAYFFVIFQPNGSLFVPASLVGLLVFLMIPIATGVAVLRYRLYDIDIVIERTLVYGLTSAAIGAAFFGGIVVLQAALRPLTGGSEVAVAASTLVCFALFQPVRRRAQSTVDRRFYRSRYDASRTLDVFTSRIAGEVDIDAVGADLAEAVVTTVRPVHVSLWLRKPEP